MAHQYHHVASGRFGVTGKPPHQHSTGPNKSVLVVSDSLFVAEALIATLGLQSAWSARPGTLHTEGKATVGPAVALIVSPDGDSAGRTTRSIRRYWATCKVITAGVANREEDVLAAFRAGADGVVLLDESLRDVRIALQAVLAGEFRPPPSLLRPLVDRLIWLGGAHGQTAGRGAMRRLSARQIDILLRIAHGESNKEIAVGTGLEVQTIKNHVSRLLRKLEVRSRFDAARVAASYVRGSP